MKHKTKCRLVFALYQDNQADEAEKVILISYVILKVFTEQCYRKPFKDSQNAAADRLTYDYSML